MNKSKFSSPTTSPILTHTPALQIMNLLSKEMQAKQLKVKDTLVAWSKILGYPEDGVGSVPALLNLGKLNLTPLA